MSGKNTLLYCPFCGSEAEIERCGDHRQSTIYQCTSCSCSLETGEEWGHGADWNRRAPDPVRDDMLAALKECQSALAMVIDPKEIAGSTVLNAFALCTAAEVKARAALSKATGGAGHG